MQVQIEWQQNLKMKMNQRKVISIKQVQANNSLDLKTVPKINKNFKVKWPLLLQISFWLDHASVVWSLLSINDIITYF